MPCRWSPSICWPLIKMEPMAPSCCCPSDLPDSTRLARLLSNITQHRSLHSIPISPSAVVPSSSELRHPGSLWTVSCQEIHFPMKLACAPAPPAHMFFLQLAPHLWGPHKSTSLWVFSKAVLLLLACTPCSWLMGVSTPMQNPTPQLSVHTSQPS